MTFEEARAQFPVLERYAYLNAGHERPARSRDRRGRDGAGRARAAGGTERAAAVRARCSSSARSPGASLAAVIDVDPTLVALTDSTTRGCGVVMTGLGLGPEDEIVITDQEHFGLTGPVHASGARIVVAPADEDAILAAVTPRTKLLAHVARALDDRPAARPRAPARRRAACRCSSTARSRPARSRSTRSRSTSTPSPPRSGCAGRSRPARSTCATRSGCGSRRPATSAQTAYEPSGAFTPKDGAARFDTGWIGVPVLAGLVTALGTHPEWRYERAAETGGALPRAARRSASRC